MKLTRATVIATLATATLSVSTRAASARSFTSLGDVQQCVPTTRGVWVASQGGLARVSYDGRVQGVWTRLDGLPGTRVGAILVDGSRLIIGGEAGLAFADHDGHRLSVRRRLASAPVRALLRHQGVVYAGTWGKGVLRVDATGLRAVGFAGGRARFRERVTSLAVAGGVLLAGSAGSGVLELRADKKLAPRAGVDPAMMVWALAAQGREVFVGGVDGLSRLSPAGRTQVIYAGDTRAIDVSPAGVLIASLGGGVRRVRGARTVALPGAPRAAIFAQAIAVTPRGSCLGTKRGLWVRAPGRAAWRAAALGGLPANDISSVARDGGRLWIGTFDHGLAVLEGGVIRAVGAGVIEPHVNAIAIEHPGSPRARIWVATANGLFALRGRHITSFKPRDGLPSRVVLSVAVLRGGGVVAGTAHGAVLLRGGRPQVIGSKHMVLGNVWSVAQDAGGTLWLGTTRGVYRGTPGRTWRRYTVSSGHLRDDWVMAIAASGQSVWVGTYKGGVTRFDLRGRAPAVTQLGGGWINPGGLQVAGGRVYAATMDGPREYTALGWRAAVLLTLGTDTTAVLPVGSTLWIASRRGLLHTRPAPLAIRLPKF